MIRFAPTSVRSFRLLGCMLAMGWILAMPAPSEAIEERKSNITVFEDSAPETEESEGPSLKPEELRVRELSRQADEKLDEIIGDLKMLIAETDDSDPDKPNFYVNLADHYWEKAETFFQAAYAEPLENEIFAAEKAGNTAKTEQLLSRQKAFLDSQNQWRQRTVETYRTVVGRFPNHPRIDEVLFHLGLHQSLNGQREEGYQTFIQLLQNHQGSSYVPDALVKIGEYFFELNQFDTALQFYDKVVSGYPNSIGYGFSVYKAGWCYFNMGEYHRALNSFLHVIKYSDSEEGSGTRNRMALRREAQKDLVRAYSLIGNPDKALGFFDRIAPDISMELGQRLADHYNARSQYDRAIRMLRKLIEQEPESHEVLRYQRKIVSAVYRGQQRKETIAEVDRMLRLYRHLAATAPAAWLNEERQAVEEELRVIGSTWHQVAEKTGNKVLLGLSADMYRSYLELFPSGDHVYAITMNYALLLKTLKKYDEAGHQFERVLAMQPKGKYAADAAYYAMYNYYMHVDLGSGIVKNQEDAEGLGPQTLPENAARMITACERYLSLAGPRGENVPEASYAAGKLYYEYNHYDPAITLFESVVQNFPKHANAPGAAKLLLSSLNLKHDFEALEAWAVRLAGTPLGTGDIQDMVTRIRDQAEFNKCFKFEVEKAHLQAARCFLSYATSFAKGELYDRSLFNAAVNFNLAKEIQKSIQTFAKLYNDRSRSTLAPKALFAIAEIYRNLAVYSEASAQYELFVQNHRKHKRAEKALQYASMFRKALGEYEAALENYALYLRLFPNSESAAGVHFDAGQIHEKLQNWARMQKHFEKHLKKYGRQNIDLALGARLKAGMALWKRKKIKNAVKRFNGVLSTYQSLTPEEREQLTPLGISYVAEAQFMLGEELLAKSRKVKFTARTLKKALKTKQAAMASAEKAFVQVISLKQPRWIIAGFNRLGLAYADLATTLETAPMPPRLNEDQQEMYRDELDKAVQPVKKKAIQAFSQCLARAADFQWFNEFSDEAARQLSRLDYRFKFVKEYRAKPSFWTANANPTSFIGTRQGIQAKASGGTEESEKEATP